MITREMEWKTAKEMGITAAKAEKMVIAGLLEKSVWENWGFDKKGNPKRLKDDIRYKNK